MMLFIYDLHLKLSSIHRLILAFDVLLSPPCLCKGIHPGIGSFVLPMYVNRCSLSVAYPLTRKITRQSNLSRYLSAQWLVAVVS